MMRVSLPSSGARVFRQYSSTAKPAQYPYRMAPEKLRALISLYHQCDTFITPNNLSQRIDEAFLKEHTKENGLAKGNLTTVTHLHGLIKQERLYPRLSEWYNMPPEKTTTGIWSGSGVSQRESQVIEALYGVDASDGSEHRRMPGLEILLDEHEKKALKDQGLHTTEESSH